MQIDEVIIVIMAVNQVKGVLVLLLHLARLDLLLIRRRILLMRAPHLRIVSLNLQCRGLQLHGPTRAALDCLRDLLLFSL